MNVYRGSNRRQVGGGLFSTISRGARPIILSLLSRFKPHVINATKAVGKRAAKAALNVGADMASNLITGRLNKRKAKDIIESELNEIKSDAGKVVDGYKQRFAQFGSGKRRKLNKMPKRKTINKNKPKRKTKARATKRLNKQKSKRTPKRRVKRRTKRTKDIFG